MVITYRNLKLHIPVHVLKNTK